MTIPTHMQFANCIRQKELHFHAMHLLVPTWVLWRNMMKELLYLAVMTALALWIDAKLFGG